MGKIIRLKQNSADWTEWRKSGLGASDAPIIMEKSPWSTPYKLYLEKTTDQNFFQENRATQKGRALEKKSKEISRRKARSDFYTQMLPTPKISLDVCIPRWNQHGR